MALKTMDSMQRVAVREAAWQDDANWSGPLYFSKDDDRLMVPKRRKWMGWTINTGHSFGPYLMIGTLLLPSLIIGGLWVRSAKMGR